MSLDGSLKKLDALAKKMEAQWSLTMESRTGGEPIVRIAVKFWAYGEGEGTFSNVEEAIAHLDLAFNRYKAWNTKHEKRISWWGQP